MNTVEMRMVRVYLSESDHGLNRLVSLLHDELGVRGVTVMRGIEGYGRSGRVHSAFLIDLSDDLPIILEFFEEAAKVNQAIRRIAEIVDPGHIVSWAVTIEEK